MIGKIFSSGRRRSIVGTPGMILSAVAALFSCWVTYINVVALPDALLIGILFVCGMYSLLFISLGSHEHAPTTPTFMDWVLSGASAACGVYFVLIRGDLVTRITLLEPLSTYELFFGSLLLLLTLEATRRTTGAGLTSVVLLFLA